MFRMQFKNSLILIQCTIFYHQYNFVMSLFGPNIRSAEPNEFPALVSIMRIFNHTYLEHYNILDIETHHKCTGTLVSKQDVLTAEHCIRSVFEEPFRVMVGSHDLHNATEFFPMYVWTYEYWALYRHRNVEYADHDVAFIKLIGNIPDSVAFAITGNIENNLLFGLDAVTAGWGQLNNDSLPRFLQKATLKILSKEDCESRIYMAEGIRFNVDVKEICSIGEPYAILNHGDSGGPLLFFGAVIGINNGICPPSHGNIQPYHVNLHLGIRYYYEFIQDMINSFEINFDN